LDALNLTVLQVFLRVVLSRGGQGHGDSMFKS
jgi:hypothetical protein